MGCGTLLPFTLILLVGWYSLEVTGGTHGRVGGEGDRAGRRDIDAGNDLLELGLRTRRTSGAVIEGIEMGDTDLLDGVANVDGDGSVAKVREARGLAVVDPLDGLLGASSPGGARDGLGDLQAERRHVI